MSITVKDTDAMLTPALITNSNIRSRRKSKSNWDKTTAAIL